jgi:hypothetical protein
LYKFDIATGGIDNALQTINTGAGSYSLFGVAIFGEVTVGGGGDGGGGKVPEPATMLLLGSGLLGLWGARKKFNLSRNEGRVRNGPAFFLKLLSHACFHR